MEPALNLCFGSGNFGTTYSPAEMPNTPLIEEEIPSLAAAPTAYRTSFTALLGLPLSQAVELLHDSDPPPTAGVLGSAPETTISGEWLNGQDCGLGLQSCSDGSSYVGDFKAGFKHGLGYYHFRNGDCYSCEYFGDKIHGFGIYNFANGHS